MEKEELKGTYIKYSPDITEEVFNKIILALEKAGYIKSAKIEGMNSKGFDGSYSQFSDSNGDNYGGYIWIGNGYGGEGYSYCVDNHPDGASKEISVEDIRYATQKEINIAKNIKDMEEEFILPEKWCIRLYTKEISEYISNNNLWCSGKLCWEDNEDYRGCYINSYKNYKTSFPKGFTEITFEQLKKYVMKEPTDFVLPEKWYCPYNNRGEFDEMNSFYKGGWSYIDPNDYYGCNNYCGINWHYHSVDENGVVKITFQQWKKYVKEASKKQLIIGKWYYFESFLPNYAKCDALSEEYFTSYNWIRVGNSKHISDGTWSLDDISNIREATLEEIQEFLPEGHIDLKNVFPKKWCIKNNYQEVRDYLAEKYNVPEVRTWTSYEYIGLDDSHCNNGCHGCSRDMFATGTIEISFDQFQNFSKKKGLDDAGKVGKFFTKQVKDATRSINGIEANKKADLLEYDQTMENLEDQLVDARESVDQAYQDVKPDDVVNNAAIDSYSSTYWSNVKNAENVVEKLESQKKDVQEKFDERLESQNKQIAKWEARIAKIKKG